MTDDDRIFCEECGGLAANGACRPAARGDRLDVPRTFHPGVERDFPHRCLFFTAKDGGPSGRTRWPWLVQRYEQRYGKPVPAKARIERLKAQLKGQA